MRAPERRWVDGLELDHRALRHALCELVAQRRKPRLVVDPASERRGDGHDHVPRPPRAGIADHRDRAAALGDAAHRRIEDDAPAQLGGHLDRDQLAAADEARVLRTARGACQIEDPAAGIEVEEGVQGREVAGLGGEHRPRGEVEQKARAGRGRVGELEALERLAVEAGGVGGRPRAVERDRLLELEDPPQQGAEITGVGFGQRWDQTGEVGRRARVVEHLLALGVGLERLDPVCARPGEDAILARPHPLAADLDHLAVADGVVERAPADAVAGLEDRHRASGAAQVGGRAQPRQPGADHHHVDPPRGAPARPREAAAALAASASGGCPGRRSRRPSRRLAAREAASPSRLHAARAVRGRPGTAGRRSGRSGHSGSGPVRRPARRRSAAGGRGSRRPPRARAPGTETWGPRSAGPRGSPGPR